MSLRIAIGGFLYESRSFALHPTVFADFVQPGGFPPLQRGAGPVQDAAFERICALICAELSDALSAGPPNGTGLRHELRA